MCAIVGSSDKEKFLELIELNQYRGNTSWSVSQFEIGAFKHYEDGKEFRLVNLHQGFAQFDTTIMNLFDELNQYKKYYYMGHVQAPTTSNSSIHPSNYDNDLLWHNGILKDYFVKEWQIQYGNNIEWDTELLHRHILLNKEMDLLDNVDGTFSCARYNKKDIYLFRNEISPLFYDKDLNISSVKFEDSEETEAGVMYKMNLHDKELGVVQRFETYENPYYFGE